MSVFNITDARRSGFCVEGIRDFCDKHGLDYKQVIKNGITEEQLREFEEIALIDIMKQQQEQQ